MTDSSRVSLLIYGMCSFSAISANASFVAQIQASAFTLFSKRRERYTKESPLSDPPTIRRRFLASPYAERAASRLCEEVDFESSTNRIPLFSPRSSRRCGSHDIPKRYFFTRFTGIFISLAMSQTDRIFIAL